MRSAPGRVRNGPAGPAAAGFTLVEMIVVVAMLAIVAAMGLPRIRATGYKADAAAQLARTLLQVAQRDAITRQNNVIVSVDTAVQRVRVVYDQENNDTLNASDRVVYRALEEGVRFAPPPMGRVGGGSLSAAWTGDAIRDIAGLPSVVFRRDGSASTAAEFYLALRANVWNEYRAVVVTPATGRVDIYRYTGTAWQRVTQ